MSEKITLTIRVKSNAKQTAWQGCEGEIIKLALKAAPVEGAANDELIRFLAKQFKLTQREIMIRQGHTSRIKVIELPITEKLKQFLQTMPDQKIKLFKNEI